MDLQSLVDGTYKQVSSPEQGQGKKRHNGRSEYGAAHVNPRDAYRDIPILKRPTWHNEVAAYFFFGGISAGAALVGSIAEAVGKDRYQELGRVAHYVSFATLIPCPPLLIDDLGKPGRFHHMLRIFKPSSPMNLGSWALTTHGVGATVNLISTMAHDDLLPVPGLNTLLKRLPERLLGGLGVPSSFVLAGYTGVLLGTTSIPVWYTSDLLGGLFMASAMSTGVAATSLAGTISGRHGPDDEHVLTTIGISCEAVELAVLGGYVATSGVAIKPLLSGTSGKLLAGALAALAVGAVLDVLILSTRKQNYALSVGSAAATLVGGALLRWAVVRAGGASAADRENTIDAMKPRKNNPGWWRGKRK